MTAKQEQKKAETKAAEVKATTATPAAKPEPTPAAPSKQDQTVGKLVDAWKARGVDVAKLEKKPDGKFLLLQLPNFPIVRIGASGGIDLPTIKSYPKAFEAAVEGDKLLARQKEREQKKAAASVPKPATTTVAVAPAASSQKETPTARKQRQAVAVEAQLEARA